MDGGRVDSVWEAAAGLNWQSDTSPAELVRFAALSPHRQTWAYLARLTRRYPEAIRAFEIGRSEDNLPIFSARVGSAAGADSAAARVPVFAQQHGDEPAGKEACLLLVRDLAAGRLPVPLDRLTVWIVPQLNPDGAAAGTRRNAHGQDLNRGHHVLAAAEHRALYGLLHDVAPHVTADLHELNVERDHGLIRGMTCAYDLMAEGPTNLNVGPAVRELGQDGLRSFGIALDEDGFAFRRYVRGDLAATEPGKLPRYSTLHAFDGRNTPALFGALAFITETTRHADPLARLERRVRATFVAASALLAFVHANAERIVGCVDGERERLAAGRGGEIVLRAAYRPVVQDPPLRYAYWRATSGEVGEYELAVARTETEVVRRRALPEAYWLDVAPGDSRLAELLRIFEGHRILVSRLAAPETAVVESYVVEQATPPVAAGGAWDVRVKTVVAELQLPAGALLVETRQLGARLVALLLEPESMDGLLTRDGWSERRAGPYPFRRVVARSSSGQSS